MNLRALTDKTRALCANRRYLLKSHDDLTDDLSTLNQTLIDHLDAQTILKSVAKFTQNQLSYELSCIVTSAIEAVFFEPYIFQLTFVEKRNKTEAEFALLKNDMILTDPIISTGGGLVDIISFSLRIACLIISNKTRILFLDEPFRFLSRDLQPLAGQFLREIADSLKIQLIIISHDNALIDNITSKEILIDK